MPLWPHQTLAVESVLAAQAEGQNRIVLVGPTGSGKSKIACTLLDEWVERRYRVAIYSNRKMLIDQLSEVLNKHGIDHGRRQAGHEHEYFPIQICSVGTEVSRVLKKQRHDLHDADRVIIDEAHLNKSPKIAEIVNRHVEAGACVLGLTATPLDLEGIYSHMIQAGTVSGCRDCGALVLAHHFGPDEPDLRGIKNLSEGKDLTEKQAVKVMMRSGLFGRVLESFQTLNPERKPTILFAPGVKESIWFAEQFTAAGIRAAHIDGSNVWLDGELYVSSPETRKMVMDGSRSGDIPVVCNRFVLREGIDAPWLAHGIFATVFGSLQSYLQSGGRLLRAFPGMGAVTIQDHGGNWWRHGSLNADREWRLGDTSNIVAGLRADRLRAGHEREPSRCPSCARIVSGAVCVCGYKLGQVRSRPVVQTDGSLKEMKGTIYPPRRVASGPSAESIWEKMFYRAKSRGATFRQAEALYAYENNWAWPNREWRLMPKHDLDFYLPVNAVPAERLR